MKKIVLFLIISSSVFSQEKEIFNIKINVKNIEKIEGKLHYALTDREDIFPDTEKFFYKGEVNVNSHDISFEVKNLIKGEYAIIIFQDLNENKKLDKMWFPPIPKEPYGISNNPKIFGKPKFKDAKFTLDRNMDVDIILK